MARSKAASAFLAGAAAAGSCCERGSGELPDARGIEPCFGRRRSVVLRARPSPSCSSRAAAARAPTAHAWTSADAWMPGCLDARTSARPCARVACAALRGHALLNTDRTAARRVLGTRMRVRRSHACALACDGAPRPPRPRRAARPLALPAPGAGPERRDYMRRRVLSLPAVTSALCVRYLEKGTGAGAEAEAARLAGYPPSHLWLPSPPDLPRARWEDKRDGRRRGEGWGEGGGDPRAPTVAQIPSEKRGEVRTGKVGPRVWGEDVTGETLARWRRGIRRAGLGTLRLSLSSSPLGAFRCARARSANSKSMPHLL